jgi:hypothetical protein
MGHMVIEAPSVTPSTAHDRSFPARRLAASEVMLFWIHGFMQHEELAMLKMVGTSGQLTLGKKYSGRHFEVEERANGELVLRPVRLVRDTARPGPARPARAPTFRIAEVEHVVLPAREQRNARRK